VVICCVVLGGYLFNIVAFLVLVKLGDGTQVWLTKAYSGILLNMGASAEVPILYLFRSAIGTINFNIFHFYINFVKFPFFYSLQHGLSQNLHPRGQASAVHKRNDGQHQSGGTDYGAYAYMKCCCYY
jgi:hypothetical protein